MTSFGQTTTFNDNVTFSTNTQSIWGPGNAFVSDIDVTLFNVPWNAGFGPVGGVTNVGYGFGSWGASVAAGTWGNIGSRFYMEGITAGYVDIDYPIQADITFPSANTIDRGTWVMINTDYNVTNGWALNSSPPSIGETALEMTANLNAYIHPQICTGFCLTPNVDLAVNETFPIFLINQNEAIYPGTTGSYGGSCPPPGLGYCTSPTGCGAVCLPAWIKQTTFPVNMPDNGLGISGMLDLPTTQTDDYLYGKCLGAFGSKNYVTVGVDLIKFMGNFIPPPVGTVMKNLSNSYDFGPVNFTYNLLSTTLQLSIYNQHRFDFCPNVEGTFNFPTSMNYEELDPGTGAVINSGFGPSATVELGNDLNVEYPCNYEFAEIEMDYNIKSETNFTSHIYDSLALDFIIEAMQFDITLSGFQLFPGIYVPQVCISVPYPCPTWSKPWKWCSSTVCTPGFWLIPPINIPGFSIGTGGPLISIPFSLANFKYDWYQGSYELGGFTAQNGGSFTLDAMPYEASSTGADVLCKGDATGSMTATVVNGVAPFTYYWPDGNTTVSATQTSTYSNLLAGNNYVTIEDVNGCQVVTDYFITEPALDLNIYNSIITNVDCFGNANGEISVSVTGGTAPYSYVWTVSPSTTGTASNLGPGVYMVTVTDAAGCITTGSYTVTEPAAIANAVTVDQDVSCFGGADGKATTMPTGGTYPFSFNWSTGGLGTTENNISAGAHSVTVTDAVGCNISTNFNITEPPAPLALAITHTPVSCHGGNDGTIDLTPSGGTAPYTFKWFDETLVQLAMTTEDLTNMSAQTYTVEVEDDNGCPDNIQVTVLEPTDELTAVLTSSIDVSCFAGNDGSIDASISGGTLPYTINWSNGATNEDISTLIAGQYTLDVNDNNGCITQLVVDIDEPDAALASTNTFVDVLCNGDATGAIDLSPTGGTAPYSFAWSNSAISEDLTDVVAGNYTVTITDDKGCTFNDAAVISEPTAMTQTNSSVAVLCHGGNDGSVTVNVNGGVVPYAYSWSDMLNNQLSATANGMSDLTAGDYTVIATDSNNCTITTTITVDEPIAPIDITATVTDVLCKGDLSGAIDVTISGGSPAYTFLWSNGAVTEDINTIASGNYDLTVTDNNGCSKQYSGFVDQPASAVEITVAKKDVLCKGEETGWAYATVTGGISPYLINWSNGETDPMNDTLLAGTYTVQAQDANGCIANSGAVINEPITDLDFTHTLTDALCFGANDGTITVTPLDGTPPYSIIFADTSVNLFNNNLNSYTIDGLGAGIYPVEVEDGNGCRFIDSVTVSQPDTLTVTGEVYDALCFGSSDGAINVDINGGTTPYTTIWSNATTNENLVGVQAGYYAIQIIDFNGCIVEGTWLVDEPDDIEINSEILDPTCRDNHDGSITIFTEGGTPDYSYLWSNSEVTESVFNLAPGQYVLIVTDEHGCEKFDTLNINFVDIDCIAPPNAFTPDGDGYNDTWILDNLDNYPEATVSIFNTWGNIVYQTDGIYQAWEGTFEGKPLPAATYYYVINLNNGTPAYSGAVTIVIKE
jgi:gliding motility-associated-like protein